MPNGRRGPEPGRAQVPSQRLQEIILEGNAQSLNEVAGQLGGYFAQGGEKDKLSSSQIRNVLDKLQRMKGFDMNRLQLLRPLLAYAAGRHGGKVRELQQISDSAIQLVQNQDHFVNFKNFFEAIVAYHRYHGGK
jgi:CRISPR-associated protein Csm2